MYLNSQYYLYENVLLLYIIYQYYPIISLEEYSNGRLNGIVSKYFNNSPLSAVSTLVKEEKISVDELKKLIDMVENKK